MKSVHEEIRDALPEYVRGMLSPEMNGKVAAHLRDCEDCRMERDILSEMIGSPVPDPGDFFWKAMPGRVAAAIGAGRKTAASSLRARFSSWLRPLPAAAAAGVLVLLVLTTVYIRRNAVPDYDPAFRDPFSAALPDYGYLEENDVPLITDRPSRDALALYDGHYRERSYYWEISSLNSEEMERLYETLKNEQKSGG